jgi:hypothetical protein
MTSFLKRIQGHLVIGLDRVYFFNYLILILTSIGYFAYLYISAIKTGTFSLKEILHQSPYSSIMMIVVLINLVTGWYLWQKKDDILASRINARWTFWPLTLCQLALGNILTASLSIFTYLSIDSTSPRFKSVRTTAPGIKSTTVAFSLFYLLCVSLIILAMSNR